MLNISRQEKGTKDQEAKTEMKGTVAENVISSASVDLSHETSACTGAGDNCILAIMPVKVKSKNSNKVVQTYAFIDPGSSATFCTEALTRQLNVQGKKTELVLSTMSSRVQVQSYVHSDLEVCGLEENSFTKLSKVFTQKMIPVSQDNIPQQKDIDRWPYLSEVKLSQIDIEVQLLIGIKEYKLLEPWQVINSKENGPYAVKTALGWIVNGPLRESTESSLSDNIRPCATVNRISMENVEQLLMQQYNHDFPERTCRDKLEMSQEDNQFMKLVSASAHFMNGHYYIGLPMKKATLHMPNNRSVAVQRAINLKRKLQKNPVLHGEYSHFISDMVDKGYAVKVPEPQLKRQDGRVWYIPHHGVYHPQKEKLRVVFDCAASFQGVSLNSELLQGPDLANSLVGVLTRFRQEPVAIMADIEAMYHQVRVPEDDTDLLRFLWWPEGDFSQALTEYKMVVHLFGATSSPSCGKTAEDNHCKSSAEAVDTVLNNVYVDDCLHGGFHLTKWTSNSRALLASVPEHERAKGVRDLDLTQDALPTERALGVLWCTDSDSFMFRISVKERPVTRRGILSVRSSVYNPLGFLAPVTLSAKSLLQQLCKEGLPWDKDIPEQYTHTWVTWLQELHQLSDLKIERCIKPVDFGPVAEAQLHHFSDASEHGYGTVSYLRMTSQEGHVHCAFLMGKSRVAPLKLTTIPRMELTAAIVAVNIDQMLQNELQLDLLQSMFWTDSTTVIKYIENDKLRFKTFVANRIAVIRAHTTPQQWRYISSSENPADCASRGLTPAKFKRNFTWRYGPQVLKEPEHLWLDKPDALQIDKDDSEIRHSINVHLTHATEDTNAMGKLINHYSSWYKLKRAVAWFLRLKDMLMDLNKKQQKLLFTESDSHMNCTSLDMTANLQQSDDKPTLNRNTLTLEDLTRAEMEIIKYSQGQSFQDEISTLTKGNKHVKRSSHLSKLDPVLQDGVLRVGGLCKSAMPEDTKDMHITTLILRDVHERIGHCGRNYMLSQLRQKYWIPAANSSVRKFLVRCVVCKKANSLAVKQKMSDLPKDRLLPDHPPFTNIGVDYFGPFNVKRGRSTEKRYGVLFTCLTTRAVHIEITHTMDTDSCLNAIRRFVCRRGQVSVMRSDNGTNLVSAERELREAMQQWNQAKN
ncbi:hypothetical protein SRHO_G00307040 [Serrasalmus rhombeus]